MKGERGDGLRDSRKPPTSMSIKFEVNEKFYFIYIYLKILTVIFHH